MILCGKKADSKLFDKPKTYILKAMIIYNVTIKVDKRIHDEWLPWMKDVHIKDVVNTGCFTHAVMLHLMEADDPEGINPSTIKVFCHPLPFFR